MSETSEAPHEHDRIGNPNGSSYCTGCDETWPAPDAEPFDLAEYYDCRDDEQLTHTTVEDAVADLVEANSFDKRESMVDAIKRIGPIEVGAYRRMAISESQREVWADHMLENLREWIDEEYGDPDGTVECFDLNDPDLNKRFRELVDHVVKVGKVWACERFESRTFSVAEVETMMRDHNPEWFEDEGSAA